MKKRRQSRQKGVGLLAVYEDLIGEIRRQSASVSATGIETAVMTGPTSLKIGGMVVTAAELMFSEHLIRPVATKVDGTVNGSDFKDKTTYLPALRAGDTVAVQRVSDALYIVLGKLVRV